MAPKYLFCCLCVFLLSNSHIVNTRNIILCIVLLEVIVSSIGRSVSSPGETPRRELKIRCTTRQELRGISSGDETMC